LNPEPDRKALPAAHRSGMAMHRSDFDHCPRKHRHKNTEMSGVLDAAARWILGGFGDRLAHRSLHLVGIGLRFDPIEIEIQQRLIDSIKILKIREGHKLVVSKALPIVLKRE
jgi:hypothetical protein